MPPKCNLFLLQTRAPKIVEDFFGSLEATAATKFDPKLIFSSTRFCLKMCRNFFVTFFRSHVTQFQCRRKKVTVDNFTSFPCKIGVFFIDFILSGWRLASQDQAGSSLVHPLQPPCFHFERKMPIHSIKSN